MVYNPDIHHRKTLRLPNYDYSSVGYYFITICIHNRECLLGEIKNGVMILNEIGEMMKNEWLKLSERFDFINLDIFGLMPNHLHGIIEIIENMNGRGESCIRPREFGNNIILTNGHGCGDHSHVIDHGHVQGDHKDRPYTTPNGTKDGSLGRIVQAFKSITTHEYIVGVKNNRWPQFNGKLWQRNYYDHIIRNEKSLLKIQNYIAGNPSEWQNDLENMEFRREFSLALRECELRRHYDELCLN
jgi:putative transposase